jgi:hypothetical protein
LADSTRDLDYRERRLGDLQQASEDWPAARRTNAFRRDADLQKFPQRLQAEIDRLEADIPRAEQNIADLQRQIRDLNAEIDQRTGFRPGAEVDYAALSYDRLGRPGTPICFATGTRVHTVSGIRPIETLREGDWVYCFDSTTDTIDTRPVTAVLRGWTDLVVEISAAGERIRSTRAHRFFVEREGWQQARVLHAGVNLHAIDGASHVVETATTCVASCETFNLEVAEHHNYFVGAAGFLVHNGDDSGFTETARNLTRIYVVVDHSQQVIIDGVSRPRVIYCGRTFQGEAGDVTTRFNGHLRSKPHWRVRQAHLEIMPVHEYLGLARAVEGNWTVFESAVWEQHFIAFFGGKTGQHRANPFQAVLENDVNAITPRQYALHRNGYGHNPCR